MYRNQLNNQVANKRSSEAKVVCAEYPAAYEQNYYALQTAIAALIIAATVWTIS